MQSSTLFVAPPVLARANSIVQIHPPGGPRSGFNLVAVEIGPSGIPPGQTFGFGDNAGDVYCLDAPSMAKFWH